MNMRLLLVEPQPEEAIFLTDVLREIEEERHFRPWVQVDTFHVVTWDEALAILQTEAIDVILMNPELNDSHGFETLRRSQLAAPNIPVVLILSVGDEALGVRLMREGAQDFLIRPHIDCAPLAHALRNAVERHRVVAVALAARFRDPLTGLANQSCFAMLADRDRRLAERLKHRWMLLLAELRDFDSVGEAYGDQRRDMTLVEMAEIFRGLVGPTDQLYRIGACRFALTAFEGESEFLEQTRGRVERALSDQGVAIGSAIFSPVNQANLDDLLGAATALLQSAGAAQTGYSRPLLHRVAGSA
jgi:PleD family two-component response regulator